MKLEWISVDERLPDPHVDVLVAAPITPNKSVTIADIGLTGEWSIEDKVRFWMPLPIAPWDTEKEGAGE